MNYSRFWHMLRGPQVFYGTGDGGGSGDGEGQARDGDAGEGESGEGEGDAEGEAGEGEGEGEGEAAAAASEGDDEGEEEPPVARVPWQNKRIDKLTAQKAATDAENERLRLELEALKLMGKKPAGDDDDGESTTTPPSGGKTYTQAEFDAAVNERAQISTLNGKIEVAYDDAAKLDPEFEKHLPAFRQAAADELKGRVDFFEAVTDLPNTAAVLAALVKDPDRTLELLEMSPAKMGMELAKLSGKLAAPAARRAISGAPPPIKPLTGQETGKVDMEKVPMEEFERRRQAEREAHRAGRV